MHIILRLLAALSTLLLFNTPTNSQQFSWPEGKQAAIREAEKLNLATNHFYFTLLGELYTGIDVKIAKECFQKAVSLAKTETERQTIQKKIQCLSITS